MGGEAPPHCRFCGLPLSSAESHEGLCANLRGHGLLSTDLAANAYCAVDRADFLPAESGNPYLDAAIVLGAGAQISAPHVHASALDLLAAHVIASDGRVAEGLRALDVGAGSGCMCTLLARLLHGRGSVLAVEHIAELEAEARRNIAEHNGDLLAAGGGLELRCEDAMRLAVLGELEEAFHLIHCGAALPAAEPWLLELLQPGGRAVVPLGETDCPQWLCSIDKGLDGRVEVKQHIRVLYVPVTSVDAQRRRGEHWEEVVERCVRNSARILASAPSCSGDEDGDELYR